MSEQIDLRKYLVRINALLAKAESSQYPEEAAAFTAKAHELMREYHIQEEELLAVDPTSVKPIHEMWTLSAVNSRFRYDYQELMREVAHHAEVLVKFVRAGDDWAVRAVGYEVDVRIAMMLWASVSESFQARVDVRYDAAVPEREMIYRLRASGIERQRVARIMWGEEIGSKASAHAKVGRIYKEECADRGEEAVLNGKGIDLATFRKAYAEAFKDRFEARLRRARDASGEAGTMVFQGRKERVREAYWDLFPEDRPSRDLDVRTATPIHGTGGSQEVEAPCEKCAKTTSKTGKCQQHRPWVPTQAQLRAWHRQDYSAAAHAGKTAGRQAADAVEINGVKRAPRIGA